MILTFNVTDKDGNTSTVRTRLATEIAFERKFDLSYGEAFNKKRHEHFYFMAWHATKTDVEFDDWVETVTAIEVEDTDTPDPSQAAVSTT